MVQPATRQPASNARSWVCKPVKEGGEATFYIPAKLAYREVGAGDKIGPNATLVFDVKLVKVGAPDAAVQQPVQVDVQKVQ